PRCPYAVERLTAAARFHCEGRPLSREIIFRLQRSVSALPPLRGSIARDGHSQERLFFADGERYRPYRRCAAPLRGTTTLRRDCFSPAAIGISLPPLRGSFSRDK